ncbi:flagellar motor switch phosphatase FliY [Cohnella sp. CFH 77786]|uniref:flagellar motor switch phosphatase FliY n=1 Tax=Cohnella sp. CFH 77786 TaxID=2662265 RepID=UPI001C60F737|nr:flagellar motor switch phosphatase FliY [Cohnella sp. CFH 77786]MBW5444565.1 flagellar motor switch phosphatase FliY [Cohnella sp. CFH 77786]
MTSKDYLSQEEIDALLRQSSGEEPEAASSFGFDGELSLDDLLTPIEQDALGEIGNITFGSAATALSTLLGRKVDITTPQVSAISRDRFNEEFPKPHVAVHVRYVDGFEGINSLVIKTHDAQVIADLMLGGEGNVTAEELNEIHISAVQEAMNQMMGSSATSMSTIFNRMVNISPPGIDILDVANNSGVSNIPTEDMFIKISFRLKIGDLIDSTIMQLLTVPFAKELVRSLMGDAQPAPAPQPAPQAAPSYPAPAAAASPAASAPQQMPQQMPPQQMPPAYHMPPQEAAYQMPPMASMPPGYGAQPSYPQTLGAGGRSVNVNPVQFASFQGSGLSQADETNLNLLLDIPLKVTVELGRTQKQIKEILELSQGSIIELDKLAGEPVDILVNNKLIAKGEVVVIDENFGVRVTDIVSQWDRVQKIQ